MNSLPLYVPMPLPGGLQCLLAGLVSQCAEQDPAEGDVGKSQGEGVLAAGEAAVVRNGVSLGKARFFAVLMPEGSDGDLLLEQCSGFCGAGAAGLVPLPRRHEKTPDGRAADPGGFGLRHSGQSRSGEG